MEIHAFIWIVTFAFLVDGIKNLLESFYSYKKKDFTSDHSKVSVIIPLYNKEHEISRTLESVFKHFPKENVFIIDDASKDGSVAEVNRIAPEVNLIALTKNGGKVAAIKKALEQVKTPFTLLLDADTVLSDNFRCPTGLLRGRITASAFSVAPVSISGKENFVLRLQAYEYMKSMAIGRKFQNSTGSVQCISGAAGLFRTKRLKELTKEHSGVFPGEDLERTLIELAHDGLVVFVDEKTISYAPEDFKTLARQRILGWWPGMWRNTVLLFKLIFKRRASFHLRMESLYSLLTLLADPLKVISLVFILIVGNWQALLLLFVFYTALELIVYLKMDSGEDKKPSIFVVPIYFFYNVAQMLFRLGGLVTLIVRYRKLALAFSFLLCFIGISITESAEAQNKHKGHFSVAYENIKDSNGRVINNTNVSVGIMPVYMTANTAPMAPRYIVVGAYLNPFGRVSVNPSVMFKRGAQTGRIIVEAPLFGPFAGRIGGEYHSVSVGNNLPGMRMGVDYYWGNYNFTSLDVIKGFNEYEQTTLVLSNRLYFSESSYVVTGAALNDKDDVGFFGRLHIHSFFFGYSSFQNFDLADFDRRTISIGVQTRF